MNKSLKKKQDVADVDFTMIINLIWKSKILILSTSIVFLLNN